MKLKPLTLTIVIPAYNEERYIEDCLISIASQTVKPNEVILVDNNCTDQTVTIAKKFKFVKIVSESKQGRAYAQKTGFDLATSDLIGRIDADSRLNNNWVEQATGELVNNPSISAITGHCYFYDYPFKKTAPIIHYLLYYLPQRLLLGSDILWGSNMVVRRDAWKLVKSRANYGNHLDEDVDLSIHLIKSGLEIKRTNNLIASVSMRRGDLGFISSIKYLSTWPRTYRINGYVLRGLAIRALAYLIILLGFPVYIGNFVKKYTR